MIAAKLATLKENDLPPSRVMISSCYIDGFGPLPLVRPGSVAELGEVVRRAASEPHALYPLGGGTSQSLGNAVVREGQAVDARGLDRIIDFPARDMTITVEAGITLGRLREILTPENLRLPIDVPRAAEATLGGVIAANVSGPGRLGYGTLRDYVIGISAVNDEGREFKAGGRVVKNVAGYDLCKLLVGSLGTLGIITQVTLKLRPRAEQQAFITLTSDDAGLETLLAQLHESRTRPIGVELLNRSAAREVLTQAGLTVPDAPWVIVVGYEGNAEAVNWQVQQLVKERAGGNSLEAMVGFTGEPLWKALVEWAARAGAVATFKANLLPSALADFCKAVAGSSDVRLRAHAGNGIVTGHFGDGCTAEQASAALNAWRGLAAKGQGRVVVVHCPPGWKKAISVWGPPSADAWLMREVKKKFDPKNVFNPGRFMDGI